jgi:hypothetical protein
MKYALHQQGHQEKTEDIQEDDAVGVPGANYVMPCEPDDNGSEDPKKQTREQNGF